MATPEECESYCFGRKVSEYLINGVVCDGCDTHMGLLSREAKAASTAVAADQEGCCAASEWTHTSRAVRSLVGGIGGDPRFDDSMRVGFCPAPLWWWSWWWREYFRAVNGALEHLTPTHRPCDTGGRRAVHAHRRRKALGEQRFVGTCCYAEGEYDTLTLLRLVKA